MIERGATERTEAWKAALRAATAERGRRAELARYLCGGDPHGFGGRKVQIIRVLDHGALPEPEFVLATLEWMDGPGALRKGAAPKAGPRRKPRS